MIAKVYSSAISGIKAQIIEVEVDLGSGLHSFNIVGLPDKSVEESKDRVSSAIKNSGALSPQRHNKRITVNLAPADIKKEGSVYDLAIAVCFLKASEQIKTPDLSEFLFLGELALDGKIRYVSGVLPAALAAKENGFKKIIVPLENIREAALIDSIEAFGVENLAELMEFLEGKKEIKKAEREIFSSELGKSIFDFSEVRGQGQAKRALEIAASGGHNILMIGSPGSGKTMLAKALASILPEMTLDESLEVSQIYSVCGLLGSNQPLLNYRPFRSPHHSASGVSLVGGGTFPKPGEISLAHRGVLFLDEMPEFPRSVLESLRQPLEDGSVSVSRIQGSVVFPAKFVLVGAMNPCPCGYWGDQEKECKCSPSEIIRYQKKLSGPLLDRIDIQIDVPRSSYNELKSHNLEENSKEIRKRVNLARQTQRERFYKNNMNIFSNSEMSSSEAEKYCILNPEAEIILKKAVEDWYLSARAYYKILKVARTAADLDNQEKIGPQHVAEALKYRVKTEEK